MTSGKWAGSKRKSTLPADWQETRKRILRRDGFVCQHVRADTERICAKPARDVDHIVPHAQGGSEADSNLQSLCPWHHSRKSGREGGRASARAREGRRPTRQHPGYLP